MTSNDTHEHDSPGPIPVLSHLSGRYRGRIVRLDGDRLRVGTEPGSEIRFSADDLTPGLSRIPEGEPYAVLERRGETFELIPDIHAHVTAQEKAFVRHTGMLATVLSHLEMTPFRLRIRGTAGSGKSLVASTATLGGRTLA